jgi:dihydrofolate synthase/folylpolyglutamate synthase
MASHQDIVTLYRRILLPYQEQFMKAHPGESLSFAELGILLALHLFEKNNVQWGMMEVGAGGRYTPLMALDVDACLLTNVGDDHPVSLGSELWQRALEKAGIARPGIPFFTSAEEPALGYVSKTALSEGAELLVLQESEIDAVRSQKNNEPSFKHRNLALACKVIRYFYPDSEPPLQKMNAHLPARFWHVAPNIIADTAHNVNKISMLAEQLKLSFPGKKFRFLLGLTRSRNVREVFAPILELAEYIVLTSASYAGQDPAELAAELQKDFKNVEVIYDPPTALGNEKKRLTKDSLLVLTGSAYMIDLALNPNPYIRHTNATFGRRSISNNV